MPRHRIVIIGSGFAGLTAARRLKKVDADITILARTSHHLFQPLLYQVATGILSEGDIAPTTREILRRQKNVTVLQALVEEIGVEARVVKWRNHNKYEQTEYDTLIVAAGAGPAYLGTDQPAGGARGMKTIDDALELRARIFGAFELAEIETDTALVGKLLTFVVVGAGPTGVEMAGQIRELASHTLKGEFRNIDPTKARVILVDGAEHPLPPFGKKLGHKTEEALAKLGVEMKMNAFVTDVDAEGVTLKYKSGEEERIESVCKVWAAGVSASPLGRALGEATGAEVDRAGRVTVNGEVVTELGVRVDPSKVTVQVDGMTVQTNDKLVYMAFNKPAGVVSTMEDPEGRPCISDFLRSSMSERVFHVGRLDVETEGLLLLTNDGELANRLTHPSYEVPKTYLVQVPGPMEPGVGAAMKKGIRLEDGVTRVDEFKLVDSTPGHVLVEVTIHSGKNRIVRRLFDAVGYPVERLVRVEMGPIRIGSQKQGTVRNLSKVEIGHLLASVDM